MKIHIKPHSPGIKDTACKDTKGIFLNDNNRSEERRVGKECYS